MTIKSKKTSKPKVIIVMPAWKAERTVVDTYREIPRNFRKHVILVDDKGGDNTASIARKLGIKVYVHPSNLGYGGNQKTCYWEALKLRPDVVVMLHPDYQYDASRIEDLVSPILKGRYDFMFGSRIADKKSAIAGGMPKLKYYVNRIVCFVQNLLLGINFTEHFSGFRAYSPSLLKTVPFQRFSNDFVFDQEMAISSLSYGMRIGEIAIPTRYHEKASSIRFFRGAKFVLEGFFTIFSYYLNKLGIKKDNRFAPAFGQPRLKKFLFLVVGLLSFFALAKYGIFNTFLVFVVSLVLFLTAGSRNFRIAGFIFYGIFAVYLLGMNFDKDVFSMNGIEEYEKIKRHQYFSREFGSFYENKLGIFLFERSRFKLNKIKSKVAASLDYSLYFSATTPSVYPVYLVPLFVIGLGSELARKKLFIFGVLAITVSLSVYMLTSNSPLLYLPLINMAILWGLAKVANIFR